MPPRHLRIPGRWLLYSSTDKMFWKTCCKTLWGQMLALGLSPSSRALLLIQCIQGALFTDAEALAAVMATRKEDKACQDGLACVTQRSVYPHFCTHLHASSHTHWHRQTCSHQHPEAYADTLCITQMPRDHIPINLQSP